MTSKENATLQHNREIVLLRDTYTCQTCGRPSKIVHHLDGKRIDHSISNLITTCQKCHRSVYHGGPGSHQSERCESKPIQWEKCADAETIRDLADYIRMSSQTIKNYIDKKQIPFIRSGSRVTFQPAGRAA